MINNADKKRRRDYEFIVGSGRAACKLRDCEQIGRQNMAQKLHKPADKFAVEQEYD